MFRAHLCRLSLLLLVFGSTWLVACGDDDKKKTNQDVMTDMMDADDVDIVDIVDVQPMDINVPVDQRPPDMPDLGMCDPTTVDVPDDQFFDANCDGIDGDREGAIYVAGYGFDENPGERGKPVRTLQKGIELAVAQGKDVYVNEGLYFGPVVLAPGVNIYGGYGFNWERSESNAAIVEAEYDAMAVMTWGGSPALVADGLGMAETVVDHIEFSGRNAGSFGEHSITIVIRDSPGLILRRNAIFAADGGPGTNGAQGGSGADGSMGDRGNNGCEDDGWFTCGSCSTPGGGSGGTSACGGGTGGRGGAPGGGSSSGSTGAAGPNGGGTGGAGGGQRDTGIVGNPGFPGAPGAGGGGGDGMGFLTGTLFVGTPGEDGGVGDGGTGGGGGGGGGGRSETDPFCDSYGGRGGGGGSGGCGGAGGGGGGAGGSSIAILVFGASPALQDNTIVLGNGGPGGRGGGGGPGGDGGPGGGGGSEEDGSGRGGPGGPGGSGGRGGPGGGGSGGASIAILSDQAVTGSMNNVITLGNPGAGGFSDSNLGAEGVTAETFVAPMM